MGAMNLTPAETGADGVFATLVDLDLRVNIVPMTAVYPFIAGGVGYGVFERSRPDGGGGLDYSTLTVPLAAGIEVLLSDVAIESRVQYRPTFFDDELRFTGAGSDSWTWTAAVGARF